MNDVPPLPYSEPLRLHHIGAGVHRRLTPDADARKRVARALDLQALDMFEVDINLVPTVSGWRLDGRVMADAVQTCGLTLEPLPVHIDRKFSVQMVEATEREPDEDAEIDLELDDDSADQIEDGRLDLGQYAVEQLALSLDPFPRKPGASFEQPPEPGEISPFAVLKGLRSSDGSDQG
ncbi:MULTISPECIES: YceD family protein [unclassified Brevundimonas]|uniref:YceD family protein n=1 Tax=unclassified Brevundimonas TaxID=2622653 RepID=UPI003F8E7E0A